MNVSISVFDDDAPPAVLLAVDAGLEAHNVGVAPIGDVWPLAVIANDATGAVVGGAVGRTWGRCCELLQLWVQPALRKQGIASDLLQRFERHAAARGCDVYYLTTLSYQAPGFYLRHGYATRAEIAGYPDGIVKYLMVKERSQPPPAALPSA
jgi:GNAT superfamily N-acetyltransferase